MESQCCCFHIEGYFLNLEMTSRVLIGCEEWSKIIRGDLYTIHKTLTSMVFLWFTILLSPVCEKI